MSIYFNLKTSEINYLSEEEVRKDDIKMAELSGYITLIQRNDFRQFDAVDVSINENGDLIKKNKEEIQNLIKNGYKPLNGDIEEIISENYRICPHCGEDIVGDEFPKTVVMDAGFSLKNIATDNIYPYKEINCKFCNAAIIDRYDILSNKEERKSFLREQMLKKVPVYVKSNFTIDESTGAYIPVFIYMKHLIAFFDVEKDENGESDLMRSLKEFSQEDILMTLEDKEMQEYFLKDGATDGINIRYLPIRLGNYSNYFSEASFDKICRYAEVGDNQKMLFELAVSHI